MEAVLAVMETSGVRIDQDYLQTLSTQLEADLQRLEAGRMS
nr:hypothetical protein [Acaryochloris sp. CCMEE 5410]